MQRLGSLCRELGLGLRGDVSVELHGVAEPAAAGPHQILSLKTPATDHW